jgi:quercetin dioxygenase-like cupin family protein
MSNGTAASGAEAQYVRVQDLQYQPVAGCARAFRKHLISSERLEVHQTLIRGVGVAEDFGVGEANRAAYVLSGTAVLTRQDREEVGQGHLIVIPAGARWGEQLSLLSEELVLLEIARAGAASGASPRPGALAFAIRPEEVAVYAPAGHAKTQNRCLFVDEHVEIIEGRIERGGGAERHSHRDHEQLLYVLSGAGIPLLIYYPKGAPHGTGGGVAEPLHLLVIYSPPLGESHNALK